MRSPLGSRPGRVVLHRPVRSLSIYRKRGTNSPNSTVLLGGTPLCTAANGKYCKKPLTAAVGGAHG